MNVDRERLEVIWRRAFGESLDEGITRVKLLVRRFGTFTRFEQDTSGGSMFDATRTTIADSDFARVAILAGVGLNLLSPDEPALPGIITERELLVEKIDRETTRREVLNPIVLKPGEIQRGHAGPTCGTASEDEEN